MSETGETAGDRPGEPDPDEIVFTGFAVVLPRSGGSEGGQDGD